jgi:hypothetical protein
MRKHPAPEPAGDCPKLIHAVGGRGAFGSVTAAVAIRSDAPICTKEMTVLACSPLDADRRMADRPWANVGRGA